jgi:hypothetical protein
MGAILIYALAISGCEPGRIQELQNQVSELVLKCTIVGQLGIGK